MPSPAAVTNAMVTYQGLALELRQAYGELDEETLADTLEGLSDLPDMLGAVVRSSLMDEAMAAALKSRLADMKARLERLEDRAERKRVLVCACMGKVGLDKLQAEDLSVSRRQGPPRLEVLDEAAVPVGYMVPQPPRLDRAGILAALKRGEPVAGTQLQAGAAHIQVRTR